MSFVDTCAASEANCKACLVRHCRDERTLKDMRVCANHGQTLPEQPYLTISYNVNRLSCNFILLKLALKRLLG